MDDDTTDAAWDQLELEQRRQREDELLKKLRKDTATFRADCDTFHAEFTRSMRTITKGKNEWPF